MAFSADPTVRVPLVPPREKQSSLIGRFQFGLKQRWLWVLVKARPPKYLTQFLIYDMYAWVCAFVSGWAALWLLLSLLAPEALLPGDSAVGTIAEVLPALMVSIFVFILGAFFVVNQQATQIHSNRASLLLLYDRQVHHAVARPLVISVATLGLALVIPDDAGSGVSALALVLVLATGFTLFSAATLLPYLITRVTAPSNFAIYVNEDVEALLDGPITALVVYRVGILGEMLKRGVRSGDSLQLQQALNGLEEFHSIYLRTAAANAEVRVHEGHVGWLGEEMVPFLVSAGQEAIGLDGANEDCNRISRTLAGVAKRSADAGHREEYERAVDGLAELGTCTQQVRVPGLINVYAEPAWGLAAQVVPALEGLGEEAAGRALALWALVVTYDIQHLGTPGHVYWERSLRQWPGKTPWQAAHDEIETEAFRNIWANKLAGITPVIQGEGEDAEVILPADRFAVHVCLARAQQDYGQLSDADE